MSKKQVGIIRNNGDVHTAQIGFHIGRVGVSVYVREYWKYKSWFIVPGVSVDAVNGTTVTLTLRRKYCLSALAYGLYGLKER